MFEMRMDYNKYNDGRFFFFSFFFFKSKTVKSKFNPPHKQVTITICLRDVT